MFFETSIYDREELMISFSKSIRRVFPKANVIDQYLNEFLVKTEANAILLLDKNILVLSEASNEDVSLETSRVAGPYFANMASKLRAYKLKVPDLIQAKMDGWLYFKSIDLNESLYYLVIFSKSETPNPEMNNYIQSFVDSLLNVIKYVL